MRHDSTRRNPTRNQPFGRRLQRRPGSIASVALPATLPKKWDNLAQPVEKMLDTEEVMLFVTLAPAHFRPFVATLFGSAAVAVSSCFSPARRICVVRMITNVFSSG